MDAKGLGSGLPTRNKDQNSESTGAQDDVIKMMQDKFLKMQLDDPERFLSQQPENVRRRVEALKDLWEKYQEHHNQFLQEVKALQLKYQALHEPLLIERKEVVDGSKGVEGAEEGDGGIPNFWLNALVKSYVVGEAIMERDLPVLAHLTDISAQLLEGQDENGFKLIFRFEDNQYFENTELEKIYYMVDLEGTMLKSATGTKINWKEGKDVTKKVMRRKVKQGQAVRGPVTKVVKADSFFSFFDPPTLPEDPEELEPEKLEEIQTTLESDYEVGATIREKIIPMAVLYYTGEARQLEEEEGLDEDFDDEGEEGEDDDDDDDEEGAGQQGQDCKQQ